MKAIAAVQTEMPVDDPREKERDAEGQHDLMYRFYAACREVCREMTYEKAANALDVIWSPLGRAVSSSSLKMTLAPGNERNYYRWEWCVWFARQSEECADVLAEIAGRGKPKKTPEDELRDLQNIVRTHYPKGFV